MSDFDRYKAEARDMLRNRGTHENPAALDECIARLMMEAYERGRKSQAHSIEALAHYAESCLKDIKHKAVVLQAPGPKSSDD